MVCTLSSPITCVWDISAEAAALAVVLPPRAVTLHMDAIALKEHELDRRDDDEPEPEPIPHNQPLWGAAGPDYRDVKQKKVLNCWWRAAEAAVVHISPDWIQNLFIDPATSRPYLESGVAQPIAPQPYVQLWNPHTYQPKWYPATIQARSTTEDKGAASFFWADALTQALGQMGKEAEINGVDRTTGQVGSISDPDCKWEWQGDQRIVTGCEDVSAEQSLTILTSYPAASKPLYDFENANGMDDQLWSYMLRCNNTPIMFTTLDVPERFEYIKMGDYHSYVVTDATWDEAGQKYVTVRNVWGAKEVFKLQDVKTIGFMLVYLRDLNPLQWVGQR